MIVQGSSVTRGVREDTEVCIVGSGAAGAILAWELAERGHKVVLLEKGGYLPTEAFTQREDEMIPRLYKNAGFQFAMPSGIIIAQGSCVGGSTVVNDAVCFRTPDLVLERWGKEFHIEGIGPSEMKGYFEKIERRLSVADVRPDEMNANNSIIRKGCETLGWSGSLNRRNCRSCRRCGLCHLGCSYGTKQSMLETYIRDAGTFHDEDVKIYSDCTAESLVSSGGRVTEVRAVIHSSEGNVPMSVRAKTFIVSAGTFASSELLLRSRLNRSGHVGRNIALHPSPAVIGDFDEEVNGHQGVPMAYHCREFGMQKTGRKGYLIESVFLAPYQFLLTLPGYIYESKELMKRYNHYAMAGILLQDDSVGRMKLGGPVGTLIFYRLTAEDGRLMVEGMQNAARIFFAAGASRVITSHRKRTVLYTEDDLPLIEERGVGTTDINLGSGHPQGGNRMGGGPGDSVVDSYGKLHGLQNLFVCDASVFPTSVGVNPQLTVMALALRTGQHIGDNWGKIATG
ncbi:MAG: GMC family oxidoreductase [Thaumarchaeota archaeon]|nr:GMC family oxidoreductase [Nitrososphaerota archaeon]